MKIEQIANTYGVDLQKMAGNKSASKPEKSERKSDSVSVSKEAKDISSTKASAETTSRRIEALPDVRADKVAEVKERIQNGFYDTEKFRSELAEKLIKTFNYPAG